MGKTFLVFRTRWNYSYSFFRYRSNYSFSAFQNRSKCSIICTVSIIPFLFHYFSNKMKNFKCFYVKVLFRATIRYAWIKWPLVIHLFSYLSKYLNFFLNIVKISSNIWWTLDNPFVHQKSRVQQIYANKGHCTWGVIFSHL